MPLRPSRTRTRTRSGIRPAPRRISPCYRHPDEPITGICASCLRERLSGLDSSIAAADAPSPELRRCRSVVSSSRCEASTSNEQRRKSCDIASARSSLSNLFDVDDLKNGSEGDARVESKNVGLTSVTYTVIQSEEKCEDEIRVPSDKLGELNADCAESSNKVEDEDFKTMKEYIDLEFQTRVKKSKDLREIAGNFLGAASVFTKKLKKWRQKNSKVKKLDNGSNESVKDNVNPKLNNGGGNAGGNHPEAMGRRSCDTEPRFSVDTGRISFEEPRASWDGYMIARTIPRLAPMFSVVEDGILGNINRAENRRLSVDGPMHSIVEDESSSGASGSGHSNSDSSSSRRQSSFDRSSSVRSFGKKAMNSEDHGVCPANVKLVITEKELKDWRLSTSRDDDPERFGSKTKSTTSVDSISHSNDLPTKKPIKWRRMRNLFGLKAKDSDSASSIDGSNEKQGKLTRSSSVGLRDSSDALGLFHHSRRSVDNADGYAFMDRNRSVRHVDSGGTPPFYMTPLRSLKNSKPGKLRLQSPHHVAGHVLQLN